jgi:hypothetical protein
VDLVGLDDLGASLSNTSSYVKLSISFSEIFNKPHKNAFETSKCRKLL